MLRFFKTDHRLFHRIIGYTRPFHGLAKTQNAEIARPGLVDPSSHPWPEWLDLMGMLAKKGYFEESLIPLMSSKESNHIRTACLNFARHRFTLVRNLSKKDIKVIAGCGCPSTDRKVVNSGKRLRAYVGIDEGNVCGSCNLRGKCERAYAQARDDEGARTIDVMRLLLTYGLDSISPTVENRACQTKLVEDSVRKLLRESVAYSLTDFESAETETAGDELQPNSQDIDERDPRKRPGDWYCTECKFLNFAKNIRCLRCDVFSEERLKQLKEEQKDHLPLKKGDWICQTCNFLNFSKNTRCLRCKDKPTLRQINPGEWECESCNYINFRRNSICLKCDHKRQKAANVTPDSKTVADRQSGVTKTWSFVEEESVKRCNGEEEEEEDGFMGFPVEGGRSNVSKSAEKREQWKLEMTQRIRSNGTKAKKDDNTKNETESKCYDRRRNELLGNISDDGEMDDWFVSKQDRST
ncbi:Ran BP2/NZF zinc finger-like superfamily protein [Arabidopsis thaliana]|uniref:Ran BP2/NZF zinc finger-like superfamily protein n=1 Tax=Arabidopsis thaliana TaxID=3702 RepID=F4I6V3_ARATH|nr:Ran BP2/NZF zinc finger-like superfamily protein [Arabidopsis thaliana]AEE35094.1 Ran BP2/NZF zinc finger-like superfamily protein [Arabidopsis thaliana]|eukprot:NP_564993.1 Ran BP2/NZF zinc finger-like superfamily protein [Arabidopsis thaliana]